MVNFVVGLTFRNWLLHGKNPVCNSFCTRNRAWGLGGTKLE